MHRRILTLLLTCVCTTPTPAAFDWPQQEVVLHAAPTDEQVQATFAFENTSDAPITITGVSTSCGCTTAALDKNTYAPGEAGEISATFEIGQRTGSQTKTLLVRTDHPDQPAVRLAMTIHIPKLIKMEPGLLLWRPNEPREPKIVHVEVLEEGVELTGVTSSSESIRAELRAVEPQPAVEGRLSEPRSEDNAPIPSYELIVTPGDDADKAGLTLHLVLSSGQAVDRQVNVRVLPAPPPSNASGIGSFLNATPAANEQHSESDAAEARHE